MTVMRLAIAGLLLSSAGCATLQPVRDPAKFIAETNPKVLHVLHKNGAVVDVAEPRMQGDTLLGVRQGMSRQLVLPMSHIQRVEAVQPNKKRTILTIAGATVVGATLGYLLAQRATGDAPVCDATSRFQFHPECTR
jgi:hypothetical protein